MRTVTFARILDGIARIYGETVLTSEDAATVAASFDLDRIEQVWSHGNWRELDVIEERFFANPYDVSAAYVVNDVVYYSGTDTYYRALQSTTGNLPTDPVNWVVATGFSKAVPFIQSGKTPIGTLNAVTLHDPRIQPSSANVPVIRREQAAQVVGVSQTSVWVRFTRRAPRFTTNPYSGAISYAEGDIVYSETTGQCYESLVAANVGNALTDSTSWQVQAIPHFAMGFLLRAGLADLYYSQDDEKRGDRQEALAFTKLDDAYYVQNRREGQYTRMEVLAGHGPVQDEPNLVSGILQSQGGDAIEIE